MKLLHLPAANSLLILTLGCLVMIYSPMGVLLFKIYRENELNSAWVYASGAALSLASIGVMFSLMFWVGGNILNLGGLILSSLLLILHGIKYRKAKPEEKKAIGRNMIRLGLAVIFGFIVYL